MSEERVIEYAHTLESLPVEVRVKSGVGSFGRKVWAVARKDLRTELRAKEVLGTMIVFSLLAVMIFGIAFDLLPRQAALLDYDEFLAELENGQQIQVVLQRDRVVPGVLWGVLFFSGLLGLNRSFGAEVDRGSLTALLLAPMDRSVIYFGKTLANFLFIAASQLLVLPMILVLFDVNLFRLWILVSLFLGIFGYVSAGVFFAALSANIRARETLLPILVLPVLVPLFVAGVSVTSAVLMDRPFGDFQHWIGMLIIYDLIFLVIPLMVFELIWEEG